MKIAICCSALFWLIANPVLHGQTTINFEDLSVGTIVTTQYASKGVVFSLGGFTGGYLFEDAHAHSGTHVLRAGGPGTEFPVGALTIQFTSGQRSAKFFASGPGADGPFQGTAQAFDAAGTVIATDGPKTVQPNDYTTSFNLTSTLPEIVKVVFSVDGFVFQTIDDLTFAGAAVVLPKVPPVVKITSPANGALLTSQNLALAGTVTGKSIFLNPWVTIQTPQPPGSTGLPFTFDVPLSGAGETRTFSWSGGVGLGSQTVTVVAANVAGLKGQASASFDYLPAAITTRFQQAGGSATFGAFSFGTGGGLGCTIAVYQKGAIFYLNNTTYIALGNIFSKWLQTRGQPRRDLQCATSEEAAVTGYTGATRQNFQNGRLYSTGGNVFYVSPVFANTIDTLGGETATGLPTSDPPLLTPTPVWNFQRFQRADNISLPSTLEISGSPPVLYIQRQGGDLTDLQKAGLPLAQSTATLESQFACSGPDGPCNVALPVAPPTLSNAAALCGNTTYPLGPREWVAVTNDQALTFATGFVLESHPSGLDNPLSHEFYGGPPDFQSDWDLKLLPLVPFQFTVPTGNPDLKSEYEEYYAHALEAGWGWPLVGDLLSVSGRWIIDCGHSDYHTELHPPAAIIFARTIQHLGRPATDAVIWVTGFYSGAPITLVVEAPPKSAPNAALVLEKPTDATAGLGLNLQVVWNPHSVSAEFSALLRQMAVDSATGEMHWQDLRGYQGEWILYWDQ